MKSILLSLALAASASAQYNCGLQHGLFGYDCGSNLCYFAPPNPYCASAYAVVEVVYQNLPPFYLWSFAGEPIILDCGVYHPNGTATLNWWISDQAGMPVLWETTAAAFCGAM